MRGCPDCSNTDELVTLEQLLGTCHVEVEDNGHKTFDGSTDVDWDSSETLRWVCEGCGWMGQFEDLETPTKEDDHAIPKPA